MDIHYALCIYMHGYYSLIIIEIDLCIYLFAGEEMFFKVSIIPNYLTGLLEEPINTPSNKIFFRLNLSKM